MMHLLLAATQEDFAAAAAGWPPSKASGPGRRPMVTPDPGVQRVELYVGDATRAVPPGKVRDIVLALTGS
jgi:hypothetical protein